MGKQYPAVSADIQTFIKQQHVFFVGTAAADGRGGSSSFRYFFSGSWPQFMRE